MAWLLINVHFNFHVLIGDRSEEKKQISGIEVWKLPAHNGHNLYTSIFNHNCLNILAFIHLWSHLVVVGQSVCLVKICLDSQLINC